MDLWLRYRDARALEYDERLEVGSQAEWQELVVCPEVVSSILWPAAPRFVPAGRSYRQRRHPHERGYRNDTARNRSYLEACCRLASRLETLLTGRRTLVYAPLRGALPIWRVLSQLLPAAHLEVYFPVTSSFVFYAPELRILNRKGRRASGRFTHILELRRLRPLLPGFDLLVYVDEIVSGGMMSGYVEDMVAEGVHGILPIVACGLADDHGRRSALHRGKLDRRVREGYLMAFLWEGCDQLITEDQRFLLGVHYVDNDLGPHVVPMLDDSGRDFEEKLLFDQDLREALAHHP